jgi:hypothetical protein
LSWRELAAPIFIGVMVLAVWLAFRYLQQLTEREVKPPPKDEPRDPKGP